MIHPYGSEKKLFDNPEIISFGDYITYGTKINGVDVDKTI
jgi:hypothetical protein